MSGVSHFLNSDKPMSKLLYWQDLTNGTVLGINVLSNKDMTLQSGDEQYTVAYDIETEGLNVTVRSFGVLFDTSQPPSYLISVLLPFLIVVLVIFKN